MINEDEVTSEEIERRGEVRGIFRGMRVAIGGEVFDTVEASRRGFFAHVDEPERFPLGQVLEATVTREPDTVRCRVEVIRKEIQPRRGVALRISFMDPANEAVLQRMLGLEPG